MVLCDDEKGNKNNCKISIWTKGNKELQSDLNLTNIHSKKYRGYHAYIIDNQESKEINLNLTIKAKVGDFIEIGALFINGDNYVQNKEINNVFGFFKKGVFENIKFDYPFPISCVDLYDQEALVYPGIENYNIKEGILKMKNKYGLDEYFYSFECKDKRKKYFNRLNQFLPLIDGAMYQISVYNDEVFGLISMKPDDDFQYLTYYMKEDYNIFNASILNCDNYPLCTMNETNERTLLYHNFSSITYNKNDCKDISPISKNQKILILRKNDKNVFCSILVNMYTNKHNITLRPDVTLLKNIKKGSEETFIVSLNTLLIEKIIKKYSMTKFKFFLNVEILSGEIELELKEGNLYKHENKYLYEKESGKIDFFNFKIKAKKNSVYNIAIYFETELKFLVPQANYLLKFNDDLNKNQLTIMRLEKIKDNIIVSFYNAKSKISVEKLDYYEIQETNNFFQDLYEKNESIYNVKLKNKRENSNSYNMSSYINYVILAKGIPHPFLFDNSKFKKINYMYLYDEENEDLKIHFTLNDNTKYNLSVLINDKQYKNYNNISKKYSYIELDKNAIKNNSVSDQLCRINFIVSPQNSNNNSIMEITINPIESKINSSGGSSSSILNNKIFQIVGSIILALLIILIIVISILCYTKKANKNLIDKINKTSFQDEVIDSSLSSNEEGESLLE